MQAKKTADANTTPASDDLPSLERRYHAHNPAGGRNDSREVLFKATMPQSNPNANQGSHPSRSSNVSANQTITANSSADKLVSQTARVHQNSTLGSRAQAHADPTATFSEKILRAIKKMGMHVRAEKTLLRASSTNADAFE